MIQTKRTNAEDQDLLLLIKQLDKELAVTDGEEHSFYDQYNKLDRIKCFIILYENESPVGCGALKEFEPGVAEVKRMFVKPESRGKGLASVVLKELEKWAAELSFRKCILETGIRQPDAIQLYKKNGYSIIPNYGQYAGVENSVCFMKVLSE
ncbi:GNAT family N-acetyltransferase [Antarcticibacterium sp. 1MA-6-2]|uniref:GNAT family N-acetyltransferase n=1 Tax=Antarcticibacterium sp. 1MA-6-2 TaxID=2908210 RepID=UPI001F36D706|nr:GNAT family N-acetyltransferase [Antarcticibacterium sp. 1MA-6-2]UJH92418.1 GNAT family N-acetyltransferase [Antarcticibacterium sp. 1MA-6-2]